MFRVGHVEISSSRTFVTMLYLLEKDFMIIWELTVAFNVRQPVFCGIFLLARREKFRIFRVGDGQMRQFGGCGTLLCGMTESIAYRALLLHQLIGLQLQHVHVGFGAFFIQLGADAIEVSINVPGV